MDAELGLDPPLPVGSTGIVALRNGRRFIGCELKESYWRTARRYLVEAAARPKQQSLFDGASEALS